MIRTLLALLPAGSRRTVLGQILLTIAGLLLRAAGTVLLVPLVAALFSGDPGTAWPWLGALAAVTAVGWAVDTWAARFAFALGFGLLDTGQRIVADRLSAVRLGWFDAERTAVARQAVAATGPDLVGIIVYLFSPLIGALLLPLFIATGLFVISWPLGLAALAGVPILLGAFALAGRLSRRADRAASEANARLTERIVEFARTQPALRAARRVEPERSLAGAALAAQHGATMRLLLLQIPGQLIFGIASQAALLLLAGSTVMLTMRGELSIPAAIALIVVIVRYLEPFTVLAELSPGIETCIGALRRIREVLEAPVDSADSPARTASVATSGETSSETPDEILDETSDERGTATSSTAGGAARIEASAAPRIEPRIAPRIELRGIRFGYGSQRTDRQVFDGFDLVLEPGTTTAIVGPSGSGKSTLLTLIAGLHAPEAGSIAVDGIDVSTLDLDARRDLVSVVFQHPYLFDGDIRQNVLVGDPAAGSDDLDRVARLARVDTLLARLSDVWESRVGEAGSSLSGGERQRVSIARALLKPAPVLLVDEATSALDAENEAAVAAALAADPVPRTRMIVAHRLSSIRAADRVVFLEAGRIVEDGAIGELLEAQGRFAEFWRQQHAAGAWRLGA